MVTGVFVNFYGVCLFFASIMFSVSGMFGSKVACYLVVWHKVIIIIQSCIQQVHVVASIIIIILTEIPHSVVYWLAKYRV